MYLTKKRKLSENPKASDAGAQSEELPPLPGRGQSEETNGTRLRISDSEESTVIDSGNGLSVSTEDLEAAASSRGKEQTGRVSLPSNPSHPTRSEEEKLVLDNVVDWDGPDDSQNPLNKSEAAKWTILLVLGSATLCVTCASSMIASTYPGVQEDFHVSREVATIPLTLFIAGLGIGPLALAPLSEFYGRTPIYLFGYLIFFAFGFLPAFGNFPGLLAGRFIQGVSGSAFLSVAGGSVTDLWVGNEIGRPMAIYSACPFTGPVLGPIMASFINQALHWRWTWYISTIWSFVELVLVIVFVPETYAPALLKKKAKRLRKETGKDQLRSRREIEEKRMGMSKTKHVIMSIGRPFGEGVLHFSTHSLTKTSQVTEILIKEPMAFALCLWCALLLGILYAFFSSYPIIFARKGFDEGEIGLAFLPMGVGIGIATVLNATYWTRSYTATSQRLGRKPPPEEHLKKAMVAAVMGPISLFWFAWSSQPRIHWAVPLVASVFFGITFQFGFTASFTYKVDAYRPYAASAMGANSFLRSSFAAAFPLFTVQMYDKLGVEWAGTIIAFLLLALTPFPFLFFRYGERLRKRSKFSDTP